MHEPIAYACLVDISWLWVADLEVRVATMPVCACCKIGVELGYVLYEPILECLNILLFLLTTKKFLPRVEQVVGGNDMVVGMTDVDLTHSSEATPPRRFRKTGSCPWYQN